GHAEGFDAIVVAVDVVRVLLAMAMIVAVFMVVTMTVIVMMVLVAAVPVVVGLLLQPALAVGGVGVGIVEAGVQDLVGIDLAVRDRMEGRAGIELVQPAL